MRANQPYRGGIFDVDGVLVDSPHERAWQESLQQLMESRWSDSPGDYSAEKFTPEVYQRVMSGKPRMSGARAVLEYFHVPDIDERVQAYADHKQDRVRELIKAGRFRAYPDALRFILAVKDAGIQVAAASSSKNAGLFLERIPLDVFADEHGLPFRSVKPGLTLLDLFDVNLSGHDFEHGKPHPMMFLACADELGLRPQECFVVEDAVSGIEAAKAGEMTGIAVARADDEGPLGQAGADLVVTSLDDVSVGGLLAGTAQFASIR